jgi:hypothetical protein
LFHARLLRSCSAWSSRRLRSSTRFSCLVGVSLPSLGAGSSWALLYADGAPAVTGFVSSLGLRSPDVRGLGMAHWLEGAGLLAMGLARNGVGQWEFALGVVKFPQ